MHPGEVSPTQTPQRPGQHTLKWKLGPCEGGWRPTADSLPPGRQQTTAQVCESLHMSAGDLEGCPALAPALWARVNQRTAGLFLSAFQQKLKFSKCRLRMPAITLQGSH